MFRQRIERNALRRLSDGANGLSIAYMRMKDKSNANRVDDEMPQHLRFHNLRHTAATILISRGVNIKVVSEMLGHPDVPITLRVYAHVLPHMQKVAADIMDVVFGELFSLR